VDIEFTNQHYGMHLSSESESAPPATTSTNEHRCELAHETAQMGAFVTFAVGDTQAELYHRVADAFTGVRDYSNLGD